MLHVQVPRRQAQHAQPVPPRTHLRVGRVAAAQQLQAHAGRRGGLLQPRALPHNLLHQLRRQLQQERDMTVRTAQPSERMRQQLQRRRRLLCNGVRGSAGMQVHKQPQ